MKVNLFPCGPAANNSEEKAFSRLKEVLSSASGDGEWTLLSNVTFSVTHQLQSDEIDVVAIGPQGVTVIEVKHWTSQWIDKNFALVENEAERVTNKAKKIGTTLKKKAQELPFVEGVILVTADSSKVKNLKEKVRGVSFYTLKDCLKIFKLDSKPCLSSLEVEKLRKALAPMSAVAINGDLRRLGGYVNLELKSSKEPPFHRIYQGHHSARLDKVIIHLYDLSASDEKDSEAVAKREFETLRNLQLYSWAPRILDSFQEAPGFAGEMFFFTLVAPAAPSIEERSSDKNWSFQERISFAIEAFKALDELHKNGGEDENIFLHRNIIPENVLVKYDNKPIFTGFDLARIPFDISIATKVSHVCDPKFVAPEIQEGGLSRADQSSDIYSLCASLKILFDDSSEKERSVTGLFNKGAAKKNTERIRIEYLIKGLESLLEKPDTSSILVQEPTLSVEFWTEDQELNFRGKNYRIISRLGSGGVGITFKVVEFDRKTGEEFGTFVAKVAKDREMGEKVLKSYNVVRSYTSLNTGLSTIFEVAQEWRANEISSLMAWIEGASLADFKGVFPLLAEDLQEDNALSLAVRWLLQMCNVLQSLHQKGVIHGDISPKNIIVNGGELVLTDYDFVTKIGNNPIGPGTLIYSSPSFQIGESVYQSDDFYALATSFYHVIFDKEPFVINGIRAKESRLNWDNLDCGEYGDLVDFFNKATHPERDKRFQNAAEVIEHLSKLSSFPSVNSKNLENDNIDADENSIENTIEFSEQKIEWLGYLLQSYPGSKYGNRETRGLDTDFAAQTYVETELEEAILRDVKERKIRLIILCGNAGDGKTALLQHLARKLGLGQKCSSERVIQGKMVDGLRVKMNLDGSAAWNGKSADELLNEFLSPFQKGLPEDDIAHFLAVNDGRLLEWTEQFLEGNKLAIQLSDFLRGIGSQSSSYIRFINMNHRSLVGGITENGKEISFNFLESLIENLYGGVDCDKIWKPCNSCTARESCEVFRAAGVFGPDKISGTFPKEKKKRARRRLFEALQAVHLRGETHITVRELRAALVYILFGVNSCDDYHLKGGRIFSPYWDRAFMANSEGRQGEVLRDLLYFDPALEANPKIDRSLLNRFYPDGGDTFPYYEKLSLSSARRKAYFEWSETEIKQVAGNEKALGLAKGKYLELFKNIALEDEGASNESQEICVRLCGGIAHLENLPPKAIERDSKNFVPLRITPRTPTDTAFWVEKPLKNFYIKPDLPEKNIGLERLHRHVFLIYKYDNGQEERLQIGADLFYLLLELCAGYQLGDVSSEGIFAHLSIFVQRLVREDDNRIFAWNPMEEESIFRLITRIDETPKGFLQRIVLEKVEEGGC